MSKPLKRYNSYFLLWKELKRKHGLAVANSTIESQLTGDIYINDFSDIASPYSYAPGTTVIIRKKGWPQSVQCLSMRDLFAQYAKGGSEHAESEFIDLKDDNLQIYENARWVDLTCVLRHLNDKLMHRFSTVGGSVKTVTSDHPCILDNQNELFAWQINEGDKLLGGTFVLEDTIPRKYVPLDEAYRIGKFVCSEPYHTLPKDCLVWNAKAQHALVAGIVDARGDVHGGTGVVGIERINLTVAQQLCELLKLLGFQKVRTYICHEDAHLYTVHFHALEAHHLFRQSAKMCAAFDQIQGEKVADLRAANEILFTDVYAFDGEYVYDVTTSSGRFYSNGLIVHNCFNYSTLDIALNGLKGISQRLHIEPPKSLATFLRQVEQFIAVAANSTLGATGLADLLLVSARFVGEIQKTGVDGHIQVVNLEEYVREQLTSLVYTLNWPFRTSQSPFSNVSLYDDTFLDSLCPDYGADKEVVKLLQRIFVSVMNAEMRRTPLTFPVTTACFATDENKEIQDKEFLRFIAEENREFGFINLYNGTTSTLSSCCFSGDTKVLWKSKDNAVHLTTFKELYEAKQDFKVFHNGNWVGGKVIELPKRKMYEVTTINNKQFVMTDNHINPTLDGEKATSELTTNDFLLFNTRTLHSGLKCDEHLTYEQGYVVGYFLGKGSFRTGENGKGSIIFSMQEQSSTKFAAALDVVAETLGATYSTISALPAYCVHAEESPVLSAFIKKWLDWEDGTTPANYKLNLNCLLQSYKFRWGILGGLQDSCGLNSNCCLTQSEQLKDCLEVLLTSLGLNSKIEWVSESDEWRVHWFVLRVRQSRIDDTWRVRNNSEYYRITSIKEVPSTGPVYCIECKNEEEPYFTLPSGLITHNCRLRSNKDNPYFNSFGAGSTKIGSLGVVTANLPRAAKQANGDFYSFIEHVHSLFIAAQRINACKRRLVGKRIELGAAPLYTHGYMDLKKQYSTFGVVGINEAIELLGEDILTERGQQMVNHLLKKINVWIAKAENEEKAPHNVEQVPAESSAVKLAQKDTMLKMGIDKPLYSNQFIPLIVKADMFDRLRLQGMFDSRLSGGAIAHINVGERIEDPETMISLMEFAAKAGVVYWAVNYLLRCCPDKHTWVGGEICPTCGKNWEHEITRVVGFFTHVKNWNPVRRTEDWPNRQFYAEKEISLDTQ